MAARNSLIRFAFVCIVLAVLVMTSESHGGHDHGHPPAKAPSAHHGEKGHGPAMPPHGPKGHGPAMPPHGPKSHGPTKPPHGPKTPAPAPSAATFSAYPQLIATALVGALSFVF